MSVSISRRPRAERSDSRRGASTPDTPVSGVPSWDTGRESVRSSSRTTTSSVSVSCSSCDSCTWTGNCPRVSMSPSPTVTRVTELSL